jgi:Sortase domain
MAARRQGQTRGRGLAKLGICLIVAGVLVIRTNAQMHRWSSPPAPPQSAASADMGWPASVTAQSAGELRHLITAPTRRSLPVVIKIPAIRVRAQVIPLGLDPSGGVAVPSLNTPFLTSWYDGGPTPGEIGPAVVLGHVDSAQVGPAVFYLLGDLRPGDLVYITLKDRRTAVFRVSSVAMYPEGDFPTARVYGFTRRPTLRLVTCGGTFDAQTHQYLDRIIVFAVYEGQETVSASRR